MIEAQVESEGFTIGNFIEIQQYIKLQPLMKPGKDSKIREVAHMLESQRVNGD